MRPGGLIAAVIGAATAGSACAEEAKAPALQLEVAEHVDYWRNVTGGLRVGDTTLNKVEFNATFAGEAVGLPGFKAHAQVFKTNGEAFSGSRVGDIETVSNIEAYSTWRLMNAWAEQTVGPVTVRGGLMDLNYEFDSVAPAGLFLDSSHGIGPDLSDSGRNGPSIFPVSSLGAQVNWAVSSRLTLRTAVFDGAPGDPDHPRAFAAVRLSAADGALVIGQADWTFAGDRPLSIGAWGYTADFDPVDPARGVQHGQRGAYAYVQGPIGRGWSGWVRGGFADGRINVVSGYLGAGVVKADPFGFKGDQAGLAIAHAIVGADSRRILGLPDAETVVEATYSHAIGDHLTLQPDLQWVIHPASQPHLRNALAVGLRINVAFQIPKAAGN